VPVEVTPARLCPRGGPFDHVENSNMAAADWHPGPGRRACASRTNRAAAALRWVASRHNGRYAVTMTPRPLAIAAAVAAAALLAVPASAAISDWSNGAKARMRLLAIGVGDDGKLAAAIEITLPKGWQTYWRFPGDAG